MNVILARRPVDEPQANIIDEIERDDNARGPERDETDTESRLRPVVPVLNALSRRTIADMLGDQARIDYHFGQLVEGLVVDGGEHVDYRTLHDMPLRLADRPPLPKRDPGETVPPLLRPNKPVAAESESDLCTDPVVPTAADRWQCGQCGNWFTGDRSQTCPRCS